MKISARNVLKGKVTNVVHGPVSAEVTIEIAPGIQVVSLISDTSAKKLELAKGTSVHAVIKASSVMVATD
jgi:molybdopterin-binding protein